MHNMSSLMKWKIIIPHGEQHIRLAIGLEAANPECRLSNRNGKVVYLNSIKLTQPNTLTLCLTFKAETGLSSLQLSK